MEGRKMDNKTSEFSEIITEMSQFAGSLAGTALVTGKKLIRYINDLTIVDIVSESPTDEEPKSKTKRGYLQGR
jgi:hypothetical protein